MGYFTELERATIDGPLFFADGRVKRDELLEFLYLLSDEVREREGELAGEALVYLRELGAVPAGNPKARYWWCWTELDIATINRPGSTWTAGNYIPKSLNLNMNVEFPDLPAALEAFVHRYCSLDQSTRDRLHGEVLQCK